MASKLFPSLYFNHVSILALAFEKLWLKALLCFDFSLTKLLVLLQKVLFYGNLRFSLKVIDNIFENLVLDCDRNGKHYSLLNGKISK